MRAARALAAATAVLACAGTASAEIACRFQTECVDTEGCEDTDFSLTLARTDGADTLHMIWDAETVELTVASLPDGSEFALGHADGAIHLLSSLTGEVRYSVHLPGVPMAITYTGTCTEAT